jgi:hypothetical protein
MTGIICRQEWCRGFDFYSAKKNDREGEARSFYGERRIWFGVYGGNLHIRHALLVPFPFIFIKLSKYKVLMKLAGMASKDMGSINCTG